MGTAGTATATVNVTVNNVNDNPVANDDTAAVDEDSTGNVIDVLANDSILPDAGETLLVTAVGTAAHGTAAVGTGGANVTYTPAADYFGRTASRTRSAMGTADGDGHGERDGDERQRRPDGDEPDADGDLHGRGCERGVGDIVVSDVDTGDTITATLTLANTATGR